MYFSLKDELLILSVSNSHIILTKDKAIDLELKLNLSPYGKTYSHIGDALYNFGTGRNYNSDGVVIVQITPEEFYNLSFIMKDSNIVNIINESPNVDNLTFSNS